MRRRVKNLVLLSLAIVCLGMSGCQYRSKKDTYILVATNLKLPYWKSVGDGFNQAAGEYQVTARTMGPDNYDAAAETEAFNNAVAEHPAGILVSAAAASALHPGIASAIGAGIPVITVDSDVPLSDRLYFIGTNNLEAGHVGGRRLVERLHGKGNVVVYSIPGQPNQEERLKGYKDILESSPGIKIVDVVATGGNSGNAFDQTEQYVHRAGGEKIDAFVCLESEAGKAIAEVLKRNNLTDRVLIAMDVDPDTLKLIEDGTIDSTVSQKPFTMGYLGLKALDEARHRTTRAFRTDYSVDFQSPYPAFVDTGSALITKDNAGQFGNGAEQPAP